MQLVVEHLTGLKAADMPDHEQFFNENTDRLFKYNSIYELFGKLNSYWNYLSYDLLAHLIKEFSVEKVKEEMEKYKIDLQQFLDETPIKVFCEAQEKKRRVEPPTGFEKLVTKFTWPDNTMLSKVEEFRQEYVCSYNLYKCALLINQINIGCFLVVWFIPGSVVDRLSSEVDEKLLSRFAVSSLEIGGRSIYLKQKPEKVIYLFIINSSVSLNNAHPFLQYLLPIYNRCKRLHRHLILL